jgi:hypothetical protein
MMDSHTRLRYNNAVPEAGFSSYAGSEPRERGFRVKERIKANE